MNAAVETMGSRNAAKKVVTLEEHIVEIMSDSGEGAQKCGQSFGSIAARMGNGVWTVEIIPAEIQPPARSVAGASGIRIRVGSGHVNNGGDETDLVVAFNEQVLLGRVRAGELKQGATILQTVECDTVQDHIFASGAHGAEGCMSGTEESGARFIVRSVAALVAQTDEGWRGWCDGAQHAGDK